MASTKLLVIIGIFLTVTTVTVLFLTLTKFAAHPPAHLLTESFQECRRRSDDLSEPVVRCISNELSPDKWNETARLYSTTTACIDCKHVCRRREQIWECVRRGVASMKDLSHKSKIMVPSIVKLAERIINTFCDYEKELFLGLTDEDMSCLKNSWENCNKNLDFISNMDVLAFCDVEGPDVANLYTMKYVCMKSVDYFDCSIRSASACSIRLVTTFSALMTTVATSASCA
ncbi:uncharacterized protein LOC124154394 [Ischnura elegans]|uniref:uncharacterized protein LOC124154394 n=1 Tax=Ischnura elegans TaxID=197161 RepID=UPI001ED88FDA|nr:uncharacterized protein LOC124154394 [Ischnura elegans]